MSELRPSVSIVICAYTQDRWDDMMAAIASAVNQPEATEVIVVIDHEPDLLSRTRRAWGGITVVPNHYRQGLSGARNTGLELSYCDIVAFLDDDAVAAEDWLKEMLSAYDSPEIVAVGGRASPVWPTHVAPVRLPPELYWIVGCSHKGLPTTRADVRNVIGCSMSLRREALLSVGGFNPDTGRVGKHPLGAEETEVCIRLTAADPTRRVSYEPKSSVQHRVTAERTTWKYLRTRSFFEGVSKAGLSKSLGAASALSSERSYTIQVLPRAVFRELRLGRPAGASAILLSLACAAVGFLYGSIHGHTPSSVRPVISEGARR